MSEEERFLSPRVKRRRHACAQTPEFRRRQRLAQVVALNFTAAMLQQKARLLGRLHPFGDGVHAQALCQLDDGHHDGLVVCIAMDVAHEGLVDLELVNLETLEVAQ